ncbi:MAG: twitch domain-containing radical SAM protein [Candidimonas sp.]
MDEIDKLRKEIIESETFCFYPFLELSTNPMGYFKPCCYYQGYLYKKLDSYDNERSDEIYSLNGGDNFDDVWNGEVIKSVRNALYDGQKIDPCKICRRDGAASMRVRSINEYKNNRKVLEHVYDVIQNDGYSNNPPSRLELKPSNLCNLKCRMCNRYDSSQIEKELFDLAEKYGGIQTRSGRFEFIDSSKNGGVWEKHFQFNDIESSDWSNNQDVLSDIKKIIPYLDVLSFAGGEPTIIPMVSEILKYCVDHNYASNITVFISSNFTNLNREFLSLMDKFKKFELIASIDGIDDVQEYCRFPSKWPKISQNFIDAKSRMIYPNVKILTNITVNLLNVINLTDLLWWIEERSDEYPYFNEWPYNLNVLLHPHEMMITNLPPKGREIAIERLTHYLKHSNILTQFPGLDSKIRLVIDQLQTPWGDEQIKNIVDFNKKTEILDKHRQISLSEKIPELHFVIKDID